MIGAVHFVQSVVIDFPNDCLSIDIEFAKVVLALWIVAIVPFVEGPNRSSDGSDLFVFLSQATGCNHTTVTATAFGSKLVVQVSDAIDFGVHNILIVFHQFSGQRALNQ